jgi:hypothetical protein
MAAKESKQKTAAPHERQPLFVLGILKGLFCVRAQVRTLPRFVKLKKLAPAYIVVVDVQ